MTEDEAKTKMCCGPQTVAMTMIVVFAEPERVEMTPAAGRCIASACMAWRLDDHIIRDGQTVRIDVRHSAGWEGSILKDDEELGGHCGLAGQPQ